MDLDLLLFLTFLAPLGWLIVRDQEKLRQNRVFWRYLTISLIILIIGIIWNYKDFEYRNLSYFGSQMMFLFVLFHKALGEMYYKLYHRLPEVSKSPKNKIDIVYTTVLIIGVLVLPFIIDNYVIQKIVN